MTKPDRSYRVMSVEQLLPQSFGPSQLEEEKNQEEDDIEINAWSAGKNSRTTSESPSEHKTTTNGCP